MESSANKETSATLWKAVGNQTPFPRAEISLKNVCVRLGCGRTQENSQNLSTGAFPPASEPRDVGAPLQTDSHTLHLGLLVNWGTDGPMRP